MRVTGAAALIAAILVLGPACGGEPGPSGGDGGRGGEMSAELRDALSEVRSTLDDLLAEVAPDADTSPRTDNEKVVPCGGGDESRTQFGYVVDVGDSAPIAAIHGAHVFFSSHELDVDTGQLSADPPAVTAEGEGFEYSAAENSEGRVVITGTTPCLPS